MASENGEIYRSTTPDEPISGVAKDLADNLVPVITNEAFQQDVTKIILGIFSAHFEQVRRNVARLVDDHIAEVQDLNARIETLENSIQQLKQRRP